MSWQCDVVGRSLLCVFSLNHWSRSLWTFPSYCWRTSCLPHRGLSCWAPLRCSCRRWPVTQHIQSPSFSRVPDHLTHIPAENHKDVSLQIVLWGVCSCVQWFCRQERVPVSVSVYDVHQEPIAPTLWLRDSTWSHGGGTRTPNSWSAWSVSMTKLLKMVLWSTESLPVLRVLWSRMQSLYLISSWNLFLCISMLVSIRCSW